MVGEASDPHIQKWAGCFARRGWSVTVVSETQHPIENVDVREFPGADRWWSRLPRVRFGGGWQRWLAGWLDWRRLLSEVNPHLVHIHYVTPDARNYFYYRGVENLVVSVYGADVVFEPDDPPTKTTVRRIRSLLRQASAVTATTEFLARETRPWMPPGKRIQVIPFGVDCEAFHPAEERENDTSGPIVLGFIKSLERKYGPDILVEAYARIATARPQTHLIIAGGGSLGEQLRRRAEELDLGDRVTFLGRIPHSAVPGLLQRIQVFVMPSVHRSETFGVAAIEASACAIPVVASRVGGVPEAVVDGLTGLLVEPGDPEGLTQACLRLIDDAALRHSLGRTGREYVIKRYSLEHDANLMASVYEGLLKGGRSP